MSDETRALTVEEEQRMRERLDGDWCLQCDEYRNPDVPRLFATLDAECAAAPLDVERLADAAYKSDIEFFRASERRFIELGVGAEDIAREYAALQASAPNPEERP